MFVRVIEFDTCTGWMGGLCYQFSTKTNGLKEGYVTQTEQPFIEGRNKSAFESVYVKAQSFAQ